MFSLIIDPPDSSGYLVSSTIDIKGHIILLVNRIVKLTNSDLQVPNKQTVKSMNGMILT